MIESYKDIADSLHLLSDWTVDDLCKESMYVRDICEEGSGIIKEMMEKLAAYEDAEEQGLMVRLPCKVGDTVYYLNPFGEIENGKITMIQQKADGTWKFRVTTDFSRDVTIDAIGKTVFLTREKAEAALKGGTGDV